MPRGPVISIEEKINRMQEKVDKLNDKLIAAKKDLAALKKKKELSDKEEVTELLAKSTKSIEEIRSFLAE